MTYRHFFGYNDSIVSLVEPILYAGKKLCFSTLTASEFHLANCQQCSWLICRPVKIPESRRLLLQDDWHIRVNKNFLSVIFVEYHPLERSTVKIRVYHPVGINLLSQHIW